MRLPATEWLVARGRAQPSPVTGWREWLLAGAGLGEDVLDRFPAGPCASVNGDGQLAAGTWARADPVHLMTALDHLQLAAPVPLQLEATEAAALLATMNDHGAGTGYKLRARDDGGWLCACPAGLDGAPVDPSLAVVPVLCLDLDGRETSIDVRSIHDGLRGVRDVGHGDRYDPSPRVPGRVGRVRQGTRLLRSEAAAWRSQVC